jgi:hypothetical protein
MDQVIHGSTGPTMNPIDVVVDGPTGPTGPVNIATIDELLESHEALAIKEAQDKVNLDIILNPTRDRFRDPLFQWATTKFEYGYMIFSLPIDAPPMCLDGQVRATGGYIQYLTGKTHEEIGTNIQSMLTGIQVFTICTDSAIEIRVIKI